MKRKLIIADDDEFFKITAVQAIELKATTFEHHTHPCPNCGCNVYYPLIASKDGVRAVEEALQVINSMATRTGLLEASLRQLYTDILIQMGSAIILDPSENKEQ